MTKVTPKRPTKPKSLAWRLGWTMTLLISQVILFVLFVTYVLRLVELVSNGVAVLSWHRVQAYEQQ